MYISVRLLKEHGACEDQVELFEQWLEELGVCRVKLCDKRIREAAAYGLFEDWVFKKFDYQFTGELPDGHAWTYVYRDGKHVWRFPTA